MLDPHSRCTYLECLRPPDGYIFDRAIGTTFSLDLLSMLMVPFSMSLYDYQNKDDFLKNPVAILEALNRTTDKIALFCQKGRINIPKNNNLLYSYLENIVIEVQLEDNNGLFHPKVWLMRFIKKNENESDILYRFICLSRNLTFDNSWDTAVVLEGKVNSKKTNAYRRNKPLSDFITTLASITNVDTKVKDHIDIMSDEVLRVKFEVPQNEGFEDEIRFIPLGIDGYTKIPKFDARSGFLAMSPFLSPDILDAFFQHSQNNILISRVDSLNSIDDVLFDKIKDTVTFYTIDESGTPLEDTKSDNIETSENRISCYNSGLHAKLYISEQGWNAKLVTGSANFTNAAFRGRNIEFLVELSGKRSQIGIEKFIPTNCAEESFFNLLKEYKRPEGPIDTDEIERELDKALENARQILSMAKLSVKISKNDDNTYLVKLKSSESFSFKHSDLNGRCYPIILTSSTSKDIAPLSDSNCVIFDKSSLESLTGFFAFELTAYHEERSLSVSFVLNLPVDGLPSNRNNSILQSIIKDRNTFVHYLFFLLADDDQYYLSQIIQKSITRDGISTPNSNTTLNPLLEELVRAYSRNPEKIERIAQVVDELGKSKKCTEKFPEGFEKLWKAFREMYQEELK